MTHTLGYIALVINLLSMTMKNVILLRSLSIVANGLYVIYASIIDAPPLIIGCSIAILIHSYHIFVLKKEAKRPKKLL